MTPPLLCWTWTGESQLSSRLACPMECRVKWSPDLFVCTLNENGLGVYYRLSLLLFVLAVYAAVSIMFGIIFCLCMVGPQPRILPLRVRHDLCE